MSAENRARTQHTMVVPVPGDDTLNPGSSVCAHRGLPARTRWSRHTLACDGPSRGALSKSCLPARMKQDLLALDPPGSSVLTLLSNIMVQRYSILAAWEEGKQWLRCRKWPPQSFTGTHLCCISLPCLCLTESIPLSGWSFDLSSVFCSLVSLALRRAFDRRPFAKMSSGLPQQPCL